MSGLKSKSNGKVFSWNIENINNFIKETDNDKAVQISLREIKKQEKFLKRNVHNFKYNNCSTNYPLDVLPDGTVIPCVSFSNRNKKISFLKYNSLKDLKTEILKKFKLDKTQYKNCIANKY